MEAQVAMDEDSQRLIHCYNLSTKDKVANWFLAVSGFYLGEGLMTSWKELTCVVLINFLGSSFH